MTATWPWLASGAQAVRGIGLAQHGGDRCGTTLQGAVRKPALPQGSKPLQVGANGCGQRWNPCSARWQGRGARTPSPAAARAPAPHQGFLGAFLPLGSRHNLTPLKKTGLRALASYRGYFKVQVVMQLAARIEARTARRTNHLAIQVLTDAQLSPARAAFSSNSAAGQSRPA
jgi:hypothetical protein